MPPVKTIPKRSGTGAIPSKTTRESNGYAEWADEVKALRADLGNAYQYADTENVQTIAQGLRRVYGVIAVTRGFDKETKKGTLWLEYPSKRRNPDDEKSPLVPDEDAVKANRDKYHK